MRFPNLSPLQSRLAASLGASLMLIILYLLLWSPNFAYAAELSSPLGDGDVGSDNWGGILDGIILKPADDQNDQGGDAELRVRAADYIADFAGNDRSIIGRVPSDADAKELANNQAVTTNLVVGSTLYFYFSAQSLKGPKSNVGSGLPSETHRRKEEGRMLHVGTETDSLEDAQDGQAERRKLENRQDGSTRLWISVNVCQQPKADDPSSGPADQLDLYISQSTSDTKPGPGQDPTQQSILGLIGGAGVLAIDATTDLNIALSSKNLTGYSGDWNVEIAASIDGPYHYFYTTESNLVLVDSDSTSALLVTQNLTDSAVNSTLFDQWMNVTPPFTIFAARANDPEFLGVANSFCALQKYADVGPGLTGNMSSTVETGMTSRGNTQAPKQQFYIKGLSPGTTYYGILAMDGNSSANALQKRDAPGSGGQVYKAMQFSTMSDGNCAVVFNLSFCDTTAYSVPTNPQRFKNASSLAAFYDNSTAASYLNFEKVLAQIACETTDSAQYSLVKTCDDCAVAYKDWLCSVSIPRCADFSSQLPWLQPRNLQQPFPNGTVLPSGWGEATGSTLGVRTSRNPAIDQTVAPGPYKEILPCEDVCYGVVQSCPAAIQFGCPQPRNMGFNSSYGVRPSAQQQLGGQLSCNFPGATFLQSGSARPGLDWVIVMAIALVVLLIEMG